MALDVSPYFPNAVHISCGNQNFRELDLELDLSARTCKIQRGGINVMNKVLLIQDK
jgi:hypothetical protein